MGSSKDLSVIILAAGKGKRMRSGTPKVLHRICGKPIIYHILKQAAGLSPRDIYVVVGHGKQEVVSCIKGAFGKVKTVVQDRQAGTAHAVMAAGSHFPGMGNNILVLSGDTPLITSDTLSSLVAQREKKDLAASIVTSVAPDPQGYGRVIRDSRGRILRVVEEPDAGPEEKKIKEVNTSIYCFRKDVLETFIGSIGKENSQGEHYLTDIIGILISEGQKLEAVTVQDHTEVEGINDRVQLAAAETALKYRINTGHMKNGVTIREPASVSIEDTVTIEPDTVICPSCFLTGDSHVEECCTIGPFTRIESSSIGRGSSIDSSVILEAEIGPGNTIGPYSYIRPGTRTGHRVKIGAFCEVKRSSIQEASKVPHLSYVGDTEIGRRVNVGASSVTVNYNGFNKYRTIIEDDAFIGSDTMLIAPVRIGKGAIVAAGSVISRDVPGDAMAIERAKQKNIKKGAVKYRNRKKMRQEN